MSVITGFAFRLELPIARPTFDQRISRTGGTKHILDSAAGPTGDLPLMTLWIITQSLLTSAIRAYLDPSKRIQRDLRGRILPILRPLHI